MGKLGLSLMN